MASNRDSKTSKTAHVMNLLSKNRSAEPAPAPQAETAAPAAAAQESAAPTAAPIPPIISSITADAAVSSQIKDALEASLTTEEPAVQTPAPPAPEPARTAPVAPKSAPEPQPQAAAPAPQSAEPAAPEAAAPQRAEYEPPAYVNVMEVLVREKAEKYMRASGMCCCDHCMVDVMAYTLSHLPPKYVVMSKGEMIPKLTFYEVQHSSDITTQLMQACKIVAKSPHHGRG